ncbi:MAG: translation initiation factor Sui1 [Desulfuromonadales bacterium]|nr:translation initiation factor Sui1 [Desulfuromonadales bacterium]
MRTSNSSLVYSSESGRICPKCRKPVGGCLCRKQATAAPAGDGIVRVGRETKGRKGKGVTLINGVPLPPDELKKLAKELKQKCGTGGTLKDGVIEIQGDHRDVLIDLLKAKGWTVKRSGG